MFNDKLSNKNEEYPINRVVIFYDNLDHSSYLGLTWQRIGDGKFPVGIDPNDSDFDTIGKTGGEKEHTLTSDELPKHSHGIALEMNNGSVSYNGGYIKYSTGYGYGSITKKGTNNFDTLAGANVGEQPHNNTPPFIVMAFWRRVA